MPLEDHNIIAEDLSELEHILRQKDYPLFIKTLKTPEGKFCYRVHNSQNRIIARSPDFDTKKERDTAYDDFLGYVEIEIHNRHQRRLFF